MVKVIPRAQNVIKCYIPVFHVLLCPLCITLFVKLMPKPKCVIRPQPFLVVG
jgi:hypothetical protein